MTLPGWNAIQSVKQIASITEVTTLVFWGLLVALEITARLWKRFSRLFDILALVSFAMAVSGEIVSHQYNSRKETLHEANEQAIRSDFSQKLQLANDAANKARADADQYRQKIDAAQQKATEVQSAFNDLKERDSYRTLNPTQTATLLSMLKQAPPQELYFIFAPDPESQSFGNELSRVLTAAGWKLAVHPYNWGTIETYPTGLRIYVTDVKNAPKGAAILQASLKKAGFESEGVSFAMVGQGHFALYAGPKPRVSPAN